MIFAASKDEGAEARPTPLFSAAASMSAANSWTSVNGWSIARVYTSVEEEYRDASTGAAMVDLGAFCRYTIRGADSAELLARLTTTPCGELIVGESARGLILNDRGAVVDFADVTRLSRDLFLLTTTGPVDRRLELATRGFGAVALNVGAEVAALGVVGPKAREIARATGFEIQGDELASQGRVRGVELAVRPINFGAAPGLEIIYPADEALTLWERLRRVAKLKPAGLDALDILRIEGGAPRLGVDFASADRTIDSDFMRTPLAIGLPHLAPPNRAWFNGRSAMKAAAEPERRLVVLALDADEAAIGDSVFVKGVAKGRVTSWTFSPKLRRALCFADIAAEAIGPRLEVGASADERLSSAEIYDSAESRLAAAFGDAGTPASTGKR